MLSQNYLSHISQLIIIKLKQQFQIFKIYYILVLLVYFVLLLVIVLIINQFQSFCFILHFWALSCNFLMSFQFYLLKCFMKLGQKYEVSNIFSITLNSVNNQSTCNVLFVLILLKTLALFDCVTYDYLVIIKLNLIVLHISDQFLT